MGRPKGSKNKPKGAQEVQEVQEELPAVSDTPAAPEVDINFITATTTLAIIAGRNYITDKLMGWLNDTKNLYPGQELELKVVVKQDLDEYTLWLDGEKVDSKHVFHADVEDVVRGVLGAR